MAKLSSKLGGVEGLATRAQGVKADTALQTETNDLSSAVSWSNVPDANITESSVTQHEAALSLTESQISDLQAYLTTVSYTDLTGKPTTLSGYGITDASTTTEINTAIANLVDSSPAALNTLNELAAALGDDENFSTTMTNALAGKVDDSQVLTNVPSGAVFTDTVFDGAYGSLSGTPTLGTASTQATGAFATAAQGALADTSIQGMADWAITQVGSDLVFTYSGTARFKLSSAGHLTVEDDVTAFGSA